MSNLIPQNRLFDDLFKDFTGGFFIRPLHGDSLPQQIRVDVQETDSAYQVNAELPGVKKEDIHVDVNGALVTLKAEIRQQDSSSDERALHSERYYGSVTRILELPGEVEADEASARYEEGVLKLVLPKRQKAPGGRTLTID
ncbi:MAG: Hsp20/alpha crystallin family protein [Halopseudomonas sp.]